MCLWCIVTDHFRFDDMHALYNQHYCRLPSLHRLYGVYRLYRGTLRCLRLGCSRRSHARQSVSGRAAGRSVGRFGIWVRALNVSRLIPKMADPVKTMENRVSFWFSSLYALHDLMKALLLYRIKSSPWFAITRKSSSCSSSTLRGAALVVWWLQNSR